MTDPIFLKAKRALEALSARPDVQELARQRKLALLTYKLELGEATTEGEAKALVLVLGRRFGPLPRDVLSRVGEANGAELEEWLERAADGATLDAVFGPPSVIGPALPKAEKELEALSGRSDAQELADQRELALVTYKLEMGAARTGGEAKALVLLLERRFGPLPSDVLSQVGGAYYEQLDEWLERAADGATLDEIFGPSSAISPEFLKTKRELEAGSGKPEVQDPARQRELALATCKVELGEARAEGVVIGKARGEVRGKAKALVLVLERRFGQLPSDVLIRVSEARVAQLEDWLERAADGATLDAVFGAPSKR